jgi:hypothetical protein
MTKGHAEQSPNTPKASMKSLKEIFERIYYPRLREIEKQFIQDIPSTIYHYTNVASFVSLMQSKTLWASRSEFLNDATEFRYGQKVSLEQIDKLKRSDKRYAFFSDRLKEALADITDSPFIACFCEDGDLLSQ